MMLILRVWVGCTTQSPFNCTCLYWSSVRMKPLWRRAAERYRTSLLQRTLYVLYTQQRFDFIQLNDSRSSSKLWISVQVSTVMSQTFAEKLNGLPVISSMLNSANPGLQKTAMSLVGNMSRVSKLRATMGKSLFLELKLWHIVLF